MHLVYNFISIELVANLRPFPHGCDIGLQSERALKPSKDSKGIEIFGDAMLFIASLVITFARLFSRVTCVAK